MISRETHSNVCSILSVEVCPEGAYPLGPTNEELMIAMDTAAIVNG